MGMNFTPEQQKVIELHNSNILVSAAAGSGKTAVLVERIIRMICDGEHPADIDRLLIVTFTNAAAAEMRERIAAGITARLETDPGNEHIQKQSALLHNAQITTIDSFSLFLIRNHFNEIGLDPDFRVADEGEIKLLQQEVLAQLLEDAYAGQFVPETPEQFHACVEYFCPGGRESVLEQHILNEVLVQRVGHGDLALGPAGLIQHLAGLFGKVGKVTGVKADSIALRFDTCLTKLFKYTDRIRNTGF